MKYLLIFIGFIVPFLSFGQSHFFIPDDESFCVLLDEGVEQNLAIDTSTYEEYYIFMKKRSGGELNNFFIIQNKEKIPGLSFENSADNILIESFEDFELNNLERVEFGDKIGLLFDSPYNSVPQFNSRGLVLEREENYFVLLFSYRVGVVNVDIEFERLLNSLLVK